MALRYWGTSDGLEGPEGYSQKLADPKYTNSANKRAWKEIPKYLWWQILGGAAASGMTVLVYMLSGKYPAATIEPQSYITNSTGTPTKEQYLLRQAFLAE